VLLSTFTTHDHRRCPYCRGEVYRERRKGLSNLTLVLAVRLGLIRSSCREIFCNVSLAST
jgi:hypothetical protein